MNGIWTDFFFCCCSLAKTLESFSGHVLLIPPLLQSFSFSLTASLSEPFSLILYMYSNIYAYMHQGDVVTVCMSSSDHRDFFFPFRPASMLPPHPAISPPAQCIIGAWLAPASTPGRPSGPAYSHPRLSEPPESSPRSERWHQEPNPCMCLWSSDKFLPPRLPLLRCRL